MTDDLTSVFDSPPLLTVSWKEFCPFDTEKTAVTYFEKTVLLMMYSTLVDACEIELWRKKLKEIVFVIRVMTSICIDVHE